MKGVVGLTQLLNKSIINETANEDLTRCREFNASARLFFIVAYSLVFLVGLLLNGFILKIYFCHPLRLSRTILIYQKNLTAADFVLSFSLLFYIINSTSSSMTIRLAYCNFGSIIFYFNMYASMLFMAYIAYNRYLKIVHPLKTHILQTVRAAHIISTITWVFLIAFLIVTMSLVKKENLTSVPNSCMGLRSTKVSLPQKVFQTCVLVVFLSILVFLVCIYYRTSHAVSLVQQSQLASSNTKKLAKSRRNMLVLVSVFCICFVPFHLVNLPFIFLGCSRSQVLDFMKDLTRVFSALNVCLDPLIYFILCKDFREHLTLKNLLFLQRDEPTPGMESGISQQQQLNVIRMD